MRVKPAVFVFGLWIAVQPMAAVQAEPPVASKRDDNAASKRDDNAASSSAQEQAYRDRIERALQHYGNGELEQARALFLEAHRLQPSARTQRGLGLVAYGLRHNAEAIVRLRAAQQDKRNPLTDAQRREAAALVAQLSVFVGHYQLETQPAAVSVTVDGIAAPEDRQELLLDLGEHQVVFSAPGFRSVTRKFDVKGGEQEKLAIKLPLSSPNAPPDEALRAGAAPASEKVLERDKPVLQQRHTWGWVAFGVATVALSGAVVAWRSGEVAAERWNDDTRCLRDGRTRSENCAGDEASANRARTWTAITLITTAVGAATGAYLFMSAEGPPAAFSTRCGPGQSEVSVACTLTF
ncbi:MAG: hypothetical protein ABW321_35190 [Polyangiales bacterium]